MDFATGLIIGGAITSAVYGVSMFVIIANIKEAVNCEDQRNGRESAQLRSIERVLG